MTEVVFLSHTGADSGAEQSTVAALASWPESEPRPVFLLGQSGAIQDRAAASRIDCEVVALDSASVGLKRSGAGLRRTVSGLLGLVRHAAKVRRVVDARSADVVVAISLKALIFGRLAVRRSRTVVWSLHDRVSPDYFPRLVVPVLRYVLPRLVDGVIVNSRSTLTTIRPGRTPVLVSAPATELDPRTFNPPGREVRSVVMVGRLAAWKGQDVFLEAFASAFADSDAEAYVVGGALFGEEDYESALRQQVGDLGIEDRVHLVGHVADPWAYLVDADVLVHASRIPEPFGLVVVQGLWARCAVVATTPGGPAEVITDGVDGLLVPCDDPGSLGRALSNLRNDAALRTRLAAAGHETARGYGARVTTPPLHEWLVAVHERGVAKHSVSETRGGSLRPPLGT